MILVTGATGIAGSEVVRALLERGERVRAFRARSRARPARSSETAVELARRRFRGPAVVPRGARATCGELVLSCADDPRRVEWETSAIDAAAAVGVRRIVKLSSIAATPGAPVAFWDWHGRVEQHLRGSGVAAVVLRSSVYMSNVLAGAEQVAREGRLYAPAGGARIAMIDPRDVGAAAAAVLTAAGHDGRTYRPHRPEGDHLCRRRGTRSARRSAATSRSSMSPTRARGSRWSSAGLPDAVGRRDRQALRDAAPGRRRSR